MNPPIEPKILKGFRDMLPSQEAERNRIRRILEKTFEACGFVAIDTPVLEYTEVLLGKGGGETDKQLYRFRDNGGRDVAMRFDLTVPFARYMAAHYQDLYLPFKRYHIAKAWRGENTQRGRYREFIQCDFDIVGADGPAADLDVLGLILESFAAMKVTDVKLRISHRGVFNAFLGTLGLGDRSGEILRTVDKLGKIGEDEILGLLVAIAGEEKAKRVIEYISPCEDPQVGLARTEALLGGAIEGTQRLRILFASLSDLGWKDSIVFDPSITRGLDYYTGVVFETYLDALPKIGSVCSGGRYNDLASLYTNEKLPGVGASIGLDRLMAGLEELGRIDAKASACDVLVLLMDEALLSHCHALAAELRRAGLRAEVYPAAKKLAAQFQYAEKKGIPLALVCGQDEKAAGTVTLKDLRSRATREGLTIAAAAETAKEMLVEERPAE